MKKRGEPSPDRGASDSDAEEEDAYWAKVDAEEAMSQGEVAVTLATTPMQFVLRIAAIVLVLGLIGGGLVYWKRQAVKRYANEWTAERHLTKAETALAEEQPKVAVRRAMTAYGLAPNDLAVTRTLLTAMREAMDSRVLIAANQLYSHPEATPEDQLQATEVVIDLGDVERATAMLEQLPESVRTGSPEGRFLGLRLTMLRGEHAEVVAAIEAIPDPVERDEPWTQLLKLEGLFRQGTVPTDLQGGDLAMAMLQKTAPPEGDPEQREWLLNGLALLPPGSWDKGQAPELLAELMDSPPPPGSGIASTLPFTLKIAQYPARRGAVLPEAFAALKGNDVDFEAFCLWLSRLRATDAIIEHIDEVQAYRSPIAYRVRIDALVAKQRFEDAFHLLQFPPQAGDQVSLKLIQAQLARQLDREADETAAWEDAMREGEADLTRNHFLNIAAAAQSMGKMDVSARALVRAAEVPLGRMPDHTQIGWVIGYLLENDQTEELLRLTQRMLRTEQHPALLNNALYLSVILSDAKDLSGETVALAEQIVEVSPQYPSHHSTLALLYCLAKRDAEALQVYHPDGKADYDWQNRRNSGRAAYALVLAMNDRTAPFEEVAAAIDWEKLSTPERRFFETRLGPILGLGEEAAEAEMQAGAGG